MYFRDKKYEVSRAQIEQFKKERNAVAKMLRRRRALAAEEIDAEATEPVLPAWTPFPEADEESEGRHELRCRCGQYGCYVEEPKSQGLICDLERMGLV